VTSRLGLLPFHIQVEIWALWILAQPWRVEYTTLPDDLPSKVQRLPGITSDECKLDDIMEALAGKESSNLMYSPSMGSPDEWATVKNLYGAANPELKRYDNLDQIVRAQLKAVLDWARSTPGRILHGNLDFRPRNLGTMASIQSILADN
jgi:hypothetical protein